MLLGEIKLPKHHPAPCPGNLWKKLWTVPTIPKCLNLAWRCCQDILPIKSNLVKRGLDVDPICPRCGQCAETVVHSLLLCEESKRAWFASHAWGGRGRMDVDEDTKFVVWFDKWVTWSLWLGYVGFFGPFGISKFQSLCLDDVDSDLLQLRGIVCQNGLNHPMSASRLIWMLQ